MYCIALRCIIFCNLSLITRFLQAIINSASRRRTKLSLNCLNFLEKRAISHSFYDCLHQCQHTQPRISPFRTFSFHKKPLIARLCTDETIRKRYHKFRAGFFHRSHSTGQSTGARFSNVPKSFRTRKAITKISNLKFTELFFSHIFNMNKVVLHAKFYAYTLLCFQDKGN